MRIGIGIGIVTVTLVTDTIFIVILTMEATVTGDTDPRGRGFFNMKSAHGAEHSTIISVEVITAAVEYN